MTDAEPVVSIETRDGATEVQPADEDANVFTVLAGQARRRSRWELVWTTAGCSVSAAFVWLQHPALHWLAAGFAATAAYGVWGLADRASDAASVSADEDADINATLFRFVKTGAVATGLAAAFVTLFSLMAMMWGVGWRH